jgi:hypothetical protein
VNALARVVLRGAGLALCALASAQREPPDFSKFAAPPREVPAGCDRARARAPEILAQLDKEIPAQLQATLRALAADREPGDTLAESWDELAVMAALAADPPAALWAELQALQLEWRDLFATNAGIDLVYLEKFDDAKLFLHCAYDMGCRSPFLLEALANVYRRTGDAKNAKLFIGRARTAAPGDPLIEAEHSLIQDGHPPAPPPAEDSDPLKRALVELEKHQELVLAQIQQHMELQNRVDAAGGTDAAVEGRRESLAQLRESYVTSREQCAQMLRDQGRFSGEMRQVYRNGIAQTAIILYIGATEHLLGMTGEVPNPLSGSSTLDVGFWGEVLGYEPVEFTRMFRELHDFEVDGRKAGAVGGWLDDFGGAPFRVYFDLAYDDLREANSKCWSAGSREAVDACNLAAEAKCCATVRKLFQEYDAVSEGWFQRGAQRFDAVAERRLAWGALQVEDAYRFAATYAREIVFKPGDKDGESTMRYLNEMYARLVDGAVGGGGNGDTRAPGYFVANQAETYRMQRENAEIEHRNWAANIDDRCDPVDLKVFEKLIEDQRKAVQAMLLERLLRDFDVGYDAKFSCSFKAHYFSASIDDTGKASLGGKWTWADKKFPDADHLPDKVEVSRNFKFNFKNGEWVGASAGVDGNAKYGPFTGKGSATFGAQWNSKTNRWDYPVEFGGTLGIGVSTKNFGATCYPGNLRIKFEARTVMQDAIAYRRSLDPD